jgi:hypothetical protein
MNARTWAVLTGCLMAAGCQDQVAPVAPQIDAPEPASNFSNGPLESGRVLRFSIDEGFFFVASDADFTTMVFHSPENGLLSNELERCSETTATTPLDFHWVETPDAVRLLVQSKESFVYVFDVQPDWFAPPDFEAPTCQELLDSMIASGRARFQFNDNDWLATGHATNSVSMKAHGLLQDLVNGGTVRYHLFVHWQFLKNVEFRDLVTRLTLDPDPRLE